MKQLRSLLFVLTLVLLGTSLSHSQDKGFGLGVILGEPTGLSGKYWLDGKSAIDGALAWSFYKGTSFDLHGDYLIHTRDAFDTQEPLLLYYGIGGRIKTGDNDNTNTELGIRGVIGIDYLTKSAPIDFFLEVAPLLNLTPSTDLFFNAGIGARYFFQ